MTYLVVGCRCLLAGTFVVAAVGKLRGRAALADAVAWVRSLGLFPSRWTRSVVVTTVAGELAVPALLAPPATVTAGFAAAAALLGAFTAAIAAALRRGKRAPCHCFGASIRPLGAPHLVRNAVLLAASAVGGLGSLMPCEVAPAPAGLAVALGAACLGVILMAVFDDLVSLFASSRPVSRYQGLP
jgi:Methylamine utilisation protein MauE